MQLNCHYLTGNSWFVFWWIVSLGSGQRSLSLPDYFSVRSQRRWGKDKCASLAFPELGALLYLFTTEILQLGILRTYDGYCNEKRPTKVELCVKLSVCDYSMLVALYITREVHFCLLGTNGYHVKATNERFTDAS